MVLKLFFSFSLLTLPFFYSQAESLHVVRRPANTPSSIIILIRVQKGNNPVCCQHLYQSLKLILTGSTWVLLPWYPEKRGTLIYQLDTDQLGQEQPAAEKQAQVIFIPVRTTWSKANTASKRDTDCTKKVAAIYSKHPIFPLPPSFPLTLMTCVRVNSINISPCGFHTTNCC